MVRALNEAMQKSSRLKIQNMLMVKTKRQFQDDIETMFSLVDRIIEERKSSTDHQDVDLLARMLNGRDPETGAALDDENIRYQIITFLIAGHETTSGLLSFALYFLLKHPDSLQKAYAEVDRILTSDTPQYEEVLQLQYIRMILNESLRLWPTAPGFDVYAKEDTMIGGKYAVKKGESLSILLPQLHRDPDAWGEDAEHFRPERFEDSSQVPHHAYKPFGNGERACIGMQFALYEATLVLGMILKHFELIDYSDYQLDVKQTLTLKPGDFKIQVKPRTQVKESSPMKSGQRTKDVKRMSPLPSQTETGAHQSYQKLLVLYGSNLGTAEGIARNFGEKAQSNGIQAEVCPLDEWSGKLPKQAIILIITASYNGKPPHNAKGFVDWLRDAEPASVQGIRYAVLGCGDRGWSGTYQSIPRYLDEQLTLLGGERWLTRGEMDAGGDMEKQVEEWEELAWQSLRDVPGIQIIDKEPTKQNALHMEWVQDNTEFPLVQTYGAAHAFVRVNQELHAPKSDRSTRHIEIILPEGVTYREGDHLGVLPKNQPDHVKRVLKRFELTGEERIKLTTRGTNLMHLPLGRSVKLRDLLVHCVELQGPATRMQLREMANHTICPPHKRELEMMLEDESYARTILGAGVSMLDLLEKYEACELPFANFLELLPPLKPRYYSISSSPLLNREQASITVSVVREPAWSGKGEYLGVASTYLSQLEPGESIFMFIRTPESGFALPEEVNTPVIMVGPGTGVAPFRGFLQARAALKQKGAELGEAHLFFGCRNDGDFIYRDELEQFEQQGVVKLHTAYSRAADQPKTYIQHLMSRKAEVLVRLLDQNGRIYICGDGTHMAPEVEGTLRQMYQEARGASLEEARHWIMQLQVEGRYVQDVWAGKRNDDVSEIEYEQTY